MNFSIRQITKIPFLFLLCFVTTVFVSELKAQEFNDEMKKKLRQSLGAPEQKPIHHQQATQILPQQNQEVLKVSPTTKLPTKFDRIAILHPLPPEPKINIDLNVTNTGNSQSDRARIDYSNGKFNPVPDTRSVTQWIQYTRGDYGVGIYTGESKGSAGFDADPVRAIQNYKARKRKEKVDRIKKAYGQE